MERINDESDLMLNEIRKELMAIIEDNPQSVNLSCKKDDNVKLKHQEGNTNERGTQKVGQNDNDEIASGGSANLAKAKFLPGSNNLDKDLQNMRLHLTESYELFQSIGDRFENLNFNGLRNRIKDLNLCENKSNVPLKMIVDDLKGDFDENFLHNRLQEVTKDVKSKFNNHSGEFGDIPEISEFFRACTQLQNGLERLKKQRSEVSDLNNRLTQAATTAYNRIDTIQKALEDETRGAAGDVVDNHNTFHN